MASGTTPSSNKNKKSNTKRAVKAVPYAWCCGVDTNESMIGCDASPLTMNASGCTEWYHVSCVGLAHLKEHQIQNMEWKCAFCIRYLSQSALLSEPNTYNSNHKSSSNKHSAIFDGLTSEEVAQLTQTMKIMQQKYTQFCIKQRQRKIKEAQTQIAFRFGITVNDTEAGFIVQFVADNRQNLQERLQNEGLAFVQSMQELMQQKRILNERRKHKIMHENQKQQQKQAKRMRNTTKNRNLNGSQRCGRLLLNTALQDTVSMDGWSAARVKAWKNRDKHSNAYFYRFNAPGEAQKNGKWSMDEHHVFMERVFEFGVNDQWGMFSQVIVGRVGYQCSNYWRGLVKEGDVTDPNYDFDGKKLHFKRNTKTFSISTEFRRYAITVNRDVSGIWTDLPQKHPLHPSEEYCESVDNALASSSSGGRVKKRKRNEEDVTWHKKRRKNKRSAEDDDETFHCNASIERQAVDNPMPDFIDCMTGNVVVKPAISTYGHVLGYDTWSMILRNTKQKDICPFTLQRLTRRELVKLTKENYNEYQDKIRNITKQQKDLLSDIHQQ
eukprot:72054_1